MRGESKPYLVVLGLMLLLLFLGLNQAAAGVYSLTLSGERQVVGLSDVSGSTCLVVLGNEVALPETGLWQTVPTVTRSWAERLPEVNGKLSEVTDSAKSSIASLWSVAVDLGQQAIYEARAINLANIRESQVLLAAKDLTDRCCRTVRHWGTRFWHWVKDSLASLRQGKEAEKCLSGAG